jgi:DNA-binding transcriptional MerR regulator
MTKERYKIGEVARRTGLTVRALRHYHDLGLVVPSGRSEAGHRLYRHEDVESLRHVLSLRALGLSLRDIPGFLENGDDGLLKALERHRNKVAADIDALRQLALRLEQLQDALERSSDVSTDSLFQLLEVVTMTDRVRKYYTEEQLSELERRAEAMGEDGLRQVELEWSKLIEEVTREMEADTDPKHPKVTALAERWNALVEAFTGGDPGISASLESVWKQETDVHGFDAGQMRRLAAYIERALGSGNSHAS